LLKNIKILLRFKLEQAVFDRGCMLQSRYLVCHMKLKYTFTKNEAKSWPIPNTWDVLALILIVGVICFFGWGAKSMLGHYQLGQSIPISLAAKCLPYYALRTVLRMLIAMGFSLFATFILGTWSAKSKAAERIIIPVIDVCQSVPILGFQAVTIIGFIVLFRGSLLGPECAAVFALFTSQAWNMILSFYQSLRSVPNTLAEAVSIFQLSPWQRFWRLDVPYAMPSLVWNAMISMSGGWVFVVAAEAISIANHTITLPGIGSYISLAILSADKTAILYSIIAMLIVIALYDQLIFRPLVAWMGRFQSGFKQEDDKKSSWLLDLFQRAEFFNFLGQFFTIIGQTWVNAPILNRRIPSSNAARSKTMKYFLTVIWYMVFLCSLACALIFLILYLHKNITLNQLQRVFFLGCMTALRVVVLIVFSSIIWVPIGVWIGLGKRAVKITQPIIQFVSAFPANLLFPPIVMLIVSYDLNINIWLSPLMILGAQWYILFNVIAGASALPRELHDTIAVLQVKGWLKWKKYILPAIFPYYITGAITAAGGAWNISIIAEAIKWGDRNLYADGLGAYITYVAEKGIFSHLALGIVTMVLFVLTINVLIWKPLYRLAQDKYLIS
jgi:NitT/TauT family transport system permease protein